MPVPSRIAGQRPDRLLVRADRRSHVAGRAQLIENNPADPRDRRIHRRLLPSGTWTRQTLTTSWTVKPRNQTGKTTRHGRIRIPRLNANLGIIGVKDSTRGERVIAGGHLDGLLDERGLVVIVRGPADHGFGVAVDDRGQEKPALPGR